MKHIAFITLSLCRGGAEGVIARLCNDYLVKHYDITIITCINKPVEYTMDEKIKVVCIEQEGVHYHNLPQRFIKRRKSLRKALHEITPDLLICFLPEPNFLALSLKGRFHFPILISVRNDPEKEYHNPVYYAFMRLLYKKADGYIFQTKDAQKYFSFSKHIQDSSVVIPNPLSTDFMNQQLPTSRRKVIVTAGRLEEQKNPMMLIKAFAMISGEIPGYTIEMYGTGNKKTEIENYLQENQLSEKITLCGNVANIKEKIQDASLFVLCSNYEGMSNALMEALALGLPSIATDCPCGGNVFLIQNKVNGIVIPVADTDALANAMKELLNHPKQMDELAIHAVESMKKLYPDTIFESWQSYLSEYI